MDGAAAGTSLEECVICLERRPEVLLPCAHAYCVPCIEQWWEYAEDPKHDCHLRHTQIRHIYREILQKLRI